MQQINPLRHSLQLYTFIRDCLAHRKNMALATVISRLGSGPRELGAAVLLTEDNITLGTIGGGLLEKKALEIAKTAIRERRSTCHFFSLTDQKVSESSMICGGQVEILVEYMDGNCLENLEIFEALVESGKSGRACRLVKSIRVAGPAGKVETGTGLIDDAKFILGSLHTEGLDIQAFESVFPRKETALITYGSIRYFIKPIVPPETVFIFGAGHVGQELANICYLTGFRTVIIDDRTELATSERFPTADEIIVINSYRDCFDSLPVNASSFTVIVTHSHLFDQSVLSYALKTPAGYIGMIASRRKRDIIFRSLIDQGFTDKDMARVHSPIGIDIGASTPAEIAVSIAAELIAVRTHLRKKQESLHNGS